MKPKKMHVKKTVSSIGSYFLNGLIALAPLLITFWFFSFLFDVVKALLAPLKTISVPLLGSLPHHEVIVGVIIIFLAGIFLKSLVVRSLMELIDVLFYQVPLVRPVYNGIKQLIYAFSPSNKESFQRVVLIEYPRKGLYSLGFQTHKAAEQLRPDTSNTQWYTIFIPVTPNPTHGFFIIVQESEIVPLKITTEDAMTIIISGGIVQPKHFN